MLKNFFLVAMRNLKKNGLYSLINILGFSLGLAVFLLISLIVIDDLVFDGFHEDADNIYRLVTSNTASSKIDVITSGALIAEIDKTVPELVAATRVHNFGQIDLTAFGAAESEQGIRRNVIGADSNFFKVFPSFKLLRGDPEDQFTSPGQAVITEEVARAMFGNEDPIGQVVKQNEDDPGITIKGIISDCPDNSHLQYDVIITAWITPNIAVWWDSWDNIALYGYVRTVDGSDKDVVQTKIREVGEKNGLNEQYLPTLQPIMDVHLGSKDMLFDNLNYGKGDKSQVLILSIIAIMTLLIASFNFINLSSARAIKRAREVGMRKVVGAMRSNLMLQFLGESIILTMIAMIIAAVSVQLLLPSLINFINKDITHTLINTPILTAGVFLSSILIGILAGIYPATVLAGFQPITVLKGNFSNSMSGRGMRLVLVVIQYSISIALIASVLIVLQQLNFLKNHDQGFVSDRTMIAFTFNERVFTNREMLMDEIRKIPTVEAVGSAYGIPGNGTFGRYEGRGEDSMTGQNTLSFVRFEIGKSFLNALDIPIIAGNNFNGSLADSGQSVILNEAALRELGWTNDAIGKRVILLEPDGSEKHRTVVGVCKDFQYASAHQQIDPLLMEYSPRGGGFVCIRIQEGKIAETVESMKNLWAELYPDREFFYQFLDERIATQYRGELNFAEKIAVFSAFAILIASLGLFGLTSYSTEQRRKEIAMRKVLGSSEPQIVYLLTMSFVKWVLFANIIAWPVAFWAMNIWLDQFAFRIEISFLPFVAACLIAVMIAVLTVITLAFRASTTNPARVLYRE